VLAVGTIAPVDAGGLAQSGCLLDPGEEFPVPGWCCCHNRQSASSSSGPPIYKKSAAVFKRLRRTANPFPTQTDRSREKVKYGTSGGQEIPQGNSIIAMRASIQAEREQASPRSYKAHGEDELAPHSEVRCSAPEVNDPVVQGEFTCFLTRHRTLARIFQTRWTERRLGVGLAGSFRPKPAASRRSKLSAFRVPREMSGLGPDRPPGPGPRTQLAGIWRAKPWPEPPGMWQAATLGPGPVCSHPSSCPQWSCSPSACLESTRLRRRHLIALGIPPDEVGKATRCRRGPWWMSGSGIVQRALNKAWLWKQGVPNLRQQWIELHYGGRNRKFDPASVNLTGTAYCGPAW